MSSASPPRLASRPLETWRARLTTQTLLVLIVFALPALIVAVARATGAGMTAFYLGAYVLVAALAFLRRFDYRLRIGVMILLGYGLAVSAASHFGLASSGRLLLMAMPIFALLLIGRLAGIIAGLSSLAIHLAFTLLSYVGWRPWELSPPDGWSWTQQGFILVMLGAQLALLVDRTLSFQEQSIGRLEAASERLERELSERKRTLALLEAEMDRRRQLETEVLEVAEGERQRIGRELHDGICQQLIAAHLSARMLEHSLLEHSRLEDSRLEDSRLEHSRLEDSRLEDSRLEHSRLEDSLAGRKAPEHAEAARLAEILETALADGRGLASGLDPQPLPAGKLGAALEELARQVRETVEVDCAFVGQEVPSLSSQWGTQLYRIAQEATWNAVKHAEPSRIVLDLNEQDDGVWLIVSDDGKGRASEAPEGLGMRSMAFRARSLGGRLRMESCPGAGFKVTCHVPLPASLEST